MREPDRRSEALLVDLDDTLFDHRFACRTAIAAVRTHERWLRRRPLLGAVRTYLAVLEEDQPAIRAGTITSAESRRRRWARLGASCGVELAPARVAALAREYRAEYERNRRAVPGAVALLQGLHGELPVVVVTNGPQEEQDDKLRFLGLRSFVDGLVTSEATGFAKPDRRIFDRGVREAGSEPGRTTMLGDSWSNDVLGALGAGVRPVWFNRFRRRAPSRPPVAEVRSFASPRQVREILLHPTGRAAP